MEKKETRGIKFVELPTLSLVMLLGILHAILTITLEGNCCFPYFKDVPTEVQRGKVRAQGMLWIQTWYEVHAISTLLCYLQWSLAYC